jgi:hypothetical protein
MELKRFTYSGKERELIVFKETNKNGEAYIEGVDINSITDKIFANKLREDAEHLHIKLNETTKKDYIADRRKELPEGETPPFVGHDIYPNFEEMIVGYRLFKKAKIEEK